MNRIKEVLEEKAIKQTWLAEKLGKSYNMVNSYLQNSIWTPPLTRKERANKVKKRDYFTKYREQARKVLETLLDK